MLMVYSSRRKVPASRDLRVRFSVHTFEGVKWETVPDSLHTTTMVPIQQLTVGVRMSGIFQNILV